MKRWYGLAVAALLCMALVMSFPPSARGQATFGNITGTVTDPAGGAVPNAQVTISDLERGGNVQTTTNDSGNYTQTHLLAGQYKIAITVPGFSDFTVTAEVRVDTSTRADAQLQIGKASTEVTVTSEAPLLRSDRAEVSTTLTGPELQKLPILDRNPLSPIGDHHESE